MASLTGFYCDGIFCENSCRSKLRILSQDVRRSESKSSSICDNCWCQHVKAGGEHAVRCTAVCLEVNGCYIQHQL
jgi:hypothetical protein